MSTLLLGLALSAAYAAAPPVPPSDSGANDTGDTGDTGDSRPIQHDTGATAASVYTQRVGCHAGSSASFALLPAGLLAAGLARRRARRAP